MHSERGSIWIPAALIAAIVAVCIGASAHALLEAGLARSRPALEDATLTGADAVGQAVAGQFARALELGIPLDKLQGVEPYLEKIVDDSPQVDGLALLDGAGKVMASAGGDTDGIAFPIVVGETRATLVVAAESPLIDQAVRRIRIALAIAALLTGMVAGAIMAYFLAFQQRPASRRLLDAMERVAAGDFSHRPPEGDRGRLFAASRALGLCIEKVEGARRHLVEAAATIRAIDFDGSLGRRVDAILAPLERRYTFAETAEEKDLLADREPRQVVWRAAVVVALYAAAFPFVANFALDRDPETLPDAWVALLPLLAELAGAVVGVLLARMPAARTKPGVAFGCVLMGSCLAATYWCRSYELFVTLRCGAGIGAGLVLGGLLARRVDASAAAVVAVTVFSALMAGPLLAGLSAEAVGRRASFLLLGLGMIALAPLIAAGAGREGSAAERAHPAGAWSRDDLLVSLAVLPASAMILVRLPTGIGFDNYLVGAGATAVLALCAMATPAMPPLLSGVALLLAAWFLHAPLPDGLSSAMLVCAALGVGMGSILKSSGARAARPSIALCLGAAAALVATGAGEQLRVPFAAVVAGVAVLVAAMQLGDRARGEAA